MNPRTSALLAGLSQVGVTVLGVVTGVIAARVLGPSDRGLLALIVFWPQFVATVGRPAFADAGVVFINLMEDPAKRAAVGRYALKLAWLLSLTFSPLFFIAIWWIFQDQSELTRALAMIYGGIMLFCSFQAQAFEGILRADKRFTMVNAFRFSVPVVYLIGIIMMSIFSLSLTAFVAAHAAAMLVSYGFRLVLVRPALGPRARLDKNEQREFHRYLATFYGGTMLTLLGAQVDRFVIFPLSTAEEIGQYVVAVTASMPVQGLVGNVITTVALPLLVTIRPERKPAAYVRLLRASITFGMGTGIMLAAAAPLFVPFLFGAAYAEAGWIALGLSLATMLAPTRRSMNQILRAEGKGHATTIGEGLFILGFMATFFGLVWLDITWPFIYAFVAANLSTIAYYVVRLRVHLSRQQLMMAFVPSPRFVLEMMGAIGALVLRRPGSAKR